MPLVPHTSDFDLSKSAVTKTSVSGGTQYTGVLLGDTKASSIVFVTVSSETIHNDWTPPQEVVVGYINQIGG